MDCSIVTTIILTQTVMSTKLPDILIDGKCKCSIFYSNEGYHKKMLISYKYSYEFIGKLIKIIYLINTGNVTDCPPRSV